MVCTTSFLTRAVARRVLSVRTAGMLRGRGLPVVTASFVVLVVRAVARWQSLAQRNHLQPVLLAGRGAVHQRQSAAGESAVGLVVASTGKANRIGLFLKSLYLHTTRLCRRRLFFPAAGGK